MALAVILAVVLLLGRGEERILYYRIPIVRMHGRISWFVRRTLMTIRILTLIVANLHVAWGSPSIARRC